MANIEKDYLAARLVTGGNFKVKFLAGQQLSDVIDIGSTTVVGLRIPTGFSGNISLLNSITNKTGSFYKLSDSTTGAFYSILPPTTLPGQIVLSPALMVGIQFLQLESDVAQVADVEIELVLGPLLVQ